MPTPDALFKAEMDKLEVLKATFVRDLNRDLFMDAGPHPPYVPPTRFIKAVRRTGRYLSTLWAAIKGEDDLYADSDY